MFGKLLIIFFYVFIFQRNLKEQLSTIQDELGKVSPVIVSNTWLFSYINDCPLIMDNEAAPADKWIRAWTLNLLA